jgi:cellulose synthase/poly-beta-1,6-N-acetylglucosamine synthase-like glycosyltransferase
MMEMIVNSVQWFFILFFVAITAGYLFINVIALVVVSRYMRWRDMRSLPSFSGVGLPVSLLTPAYNEEKTIVYSVRSLLQLNYPSYEILVINDGSTDTTLEELRKNFDLVHVPDCRSEVLPTRNVRGVYISRIHPNLKVIDKENGGKADALNAGLNYCGTVLYCCIDADSIIERNSLRHVIEPFVEDATTIATGGTIRIANGCSVRDGHLEKVGLPRNLLALFQIVEYLRAFLFGRMGWAGINGMLIISGAFGVFRRELVVEAGGYRTSTVGEDMELVVRLHRRMRLSGKPYRIRFVPDPICWTEAPEDLKTLKNQRVRWQRGLSESLSMNLSLLLHPKGGIVSWVAFPFMVVFEWLEPFIQIIGYITPILFFAMGMISGETFITFLIVVISLGILLSTNAILLEEISFHIYPSSKHTLLIYAAAILENFGYRQINAYWRLVGIFRWLFGKKGGWGKMRRKGTWQVDASVSGTEIH